MSQSDRAIDLEDLLVRPGTYFNPQTEIVVVVDDSVAIDQDVFDLEAYEGVDWVRISEEVPIESSELEATMQDFQTESSLGQADVSDTTLEPDHDDGPDDEPDAPEPDPDPDEA